jgi:hypothetical protein
MFETYGKGRLDTALFDWALRMTVVAETAIQQRRRIALRIMQAILTVRPKSVLGENGRRLGH